MASKDNPDRKEAEAAYAEERAVLRAELILLRRDRAERLRRPVTPEEACEDGDDRP